jgi:hypothetical protein
MRKAAWKSAQTSASCSAKRYRQTIVGNASKQQGARRPEPDDDRLLNEVVYLRPAPISAKSLPGLQKPFSKQFDGLCQSARTPFGRMLDIFSKEMNG